jgi:hypothetical protein
MARILKAPRRTCDAIDFPIACTENAGCAPYLIIFVWF